MSDPTPPPPPSTPPPSSPPPSSPPPPSTGGVQPSQNTLMLVLSYLYILFLVPLLAEKDDADVQWHAKHGFVLSAFEFAVWIVFTVFGMVSGGIGCMLLPLQMLFFLGMLVVRIVCIVKATKGERFVLPGITPFADKF